MSVRIGSLGEGQGFKTLLTNRTGVIRLKVGQGVLVEMGDGKTVTLHEDVLVDSDISTIKPDTEASADTG